MAFQYAYCGAWNFKGEIAGLKGFTWDAGTGTLSENGIFGEDFRGQSILTIAGDKVVSVCELGKGGRVVCYQICEDGKLTVLDALETQSAKLSYVVAAPGKPYVFVSSMGDGTVKMIRIAQDGKLTITDEWRLTGHSVTKRQLIAKVHSVMISPDGELLAAANLGADEVALFCVDYEKEALQLLSTAPVDFGKEPRHMAFTPDSKILFVLTEGGNRIYDFAVAGRKALKERAVYSVLNPEEEETGAAADILVSKDGKYVYSTNRGQNNIAVWRILESGLLDIVAYCPCGGEGPRGIFLTEGDEELLCVNNDDGSFTIMKRDAVTGLLSDTIARGEVPCAGCVRAI